MTPVREQRRPTARRELIGLDPASEDVPRQSPPGPSDAVAIRRSLCDPDAFGAVFERHFELVHRYAQRRVGPDSADELTAEAFARAFAGRRRYDLALADARPWLFGIAAKLVARHWESERRRHLARLRAHTPEGEGQSPGEGAPELVAALDELAPHDREALLLLAWADLSYEEIALALEVPVGTVRSRLARARRLLRERLSPATDLSSRAEGSTSV